MIDNQEAVRVIDANRGDGVIIATMNANNVHFGLPTVTTKEQLDMPVSGAMGKASNVGLGLALAQPERKVIVLDGDGSLLMNLGAMVTLANKNAEEYLPHGLRQRRVCRYRWPARSRLRQGRLGGNGQGCRICRHLLLRQPGGPCPPVSVM